LLFSSVFFSVRLSLSHDLGERFIQVAQVFFMLFFILSFILSFKIWFFLKLNFFFVLSHIGLSCPHDPTRVLTISLGFTSALFFNTLFFSLFFFLILSFYIFIHRDWRSLFYYFSFYDVEPWICSSFLKIQWQHLIIVFNTIKKINPTSNKTQVIYLVLIKVVSSVSSGMAETFHTNSKNGTKRNKFHLILNLGPFRIFRLNSARNVPVSFHMFRSALEKPLNQIEPCSI